MNHPLWSPDGDYLFGIADNQVWAITTDDKSAHPLTEGVPRTVRGVVHRYDNQTVWTLDGTPLVVQTASPKAKAHGFYRIDWETGAISLLFEEAKWHGWETFPNVSAAGNLLVYRSEDSSHPVDLWGV